MTVRDPKPVSGVVQLVAPLDVEADARTLLSSNVPQRKWKRWAKHVQGWSADRFAAAFAHADRIALEQELQARGSKRRSEGTGGQRTENGRPDSSDVPRDEDDGRILIEVHATGLESMAGLAVRALADDGRAYQRGSRLVQLVKSTPRAELASMWRDSEGRERFAIRAGAPMVDDLGRATLKGMLDTAASWKRFHAQSETLRPCAPPADVVSIVHEWKRWEGIRPLEGVSDAPILRSDGTVCQRAGYDERTGWWLDLATTFPAVPDQPTQADAQEAYAFIARVFADFPYAAEYQRAVPVAAILTALARAAILGSVPAFVFDAASGRTGKTLQTDAIALITTGRPAARKAYPPTDEETEKVLAGYALSGTSLVCIDDVKRPLGGEVLDMIVTCRDEVDFRILGKTDTRRLPWRAVLCTTGNNISFLGQMAARVLVARLESPLERPQDRDDFTIREPLLSYVARERARLVAAALTILRAWTCKRLDSPLGRWGGFDEWAALVPAAIAFAGGPNVLDARPPDDGDVNPEAESLRDVLRGLASLAHRASEIHGLTGADIRHALYERAEPGPVPEELRAMADALRTLTRTKQPADPTAAAIGYALRRVKGRVIRVEGRLRKLGSPESTHKGAATRWQSLDLGAAP